MKLKLDHQNKQLILDRPKTSPIVTVWSALSLLTLFFTLAYEISAVGIPLLLIVSVGMWYLVLRVSFEKSVACSQISDVIKKKSLFGSASHYSLQLKNKRRLYIGTFPNKESEEAFCANIEKLL